MELSKDAKTLLPAAAGVSPERARSAIIHFFQKRLTVMLCLAQNDKTMLHHLIKHLGRQGYNLQVS